ncbi:MAG: hypothetical protein KIS85_00425 [Anaerolineales bacterium]|nr:hypothetical protein [Anaerolineales bacterium]
MKKLLPIFLILSLAQAACSIPLFMEPTATPTEIVLPTEIPTLFVPTFTPEPTETPTEVLTPTDTPEPSETPTITPTPTPLPFDPSGSYGTPSLLDTMDDDRNWAGPGGLPDTQNLRLTLGGGRLHVTGKQPGWDTWWFTAIAPSDFFLQMRVENGNCSGQQAYGLIMRGPQSAGDAGRGYIYTFACDGSYRLERLDAATPYTKVELIPWTRSDHINDGPNETNVMGVRMVGGVITLFANGFELTELEDTRYTAGRFGVFVNAGVPGNYTYSIDELTYWNLR